MNTSETLLEIHDLSKVFVRSRGLFRHPDRIVAVEGVNLTVKRGETFGLVGESGCGKTTMARMLMRLESPSSGTIVFDGADLWSTGLQAPDVRQRIQLVFQDPYASLNPRKSVRQILEKPFRLHRSLSSDERRNRVLELLEDVGLVPATDFIGRYPHQLSGGQRQRLVIARAIALDPDLIIADEPVSALDVSVRAQILNLLRRLQAKHSLTMIFISHDLSVVRALCSRVAVMYLGRIVETGDTKAIYDGPLHPYTRALIAATPIPDPRAMRARASIPIEGEIPSALARPSGCSFHPRCAVRGDGCGVSVPDLRRLGPTRDAACHYAAVEAEAQT